MPANWLHTLGRWLLGKSPVERREILDEDGNVIGISVGRPLTKAQRALVADSLQSDQ